MTCPECGYTGLRPARDPGNGQRHYKCWSCGYEFNTVEQLAEDARRQAFRASLFRVLAGGNGSVNHQ